VALALKRFLKFLHSLAGAGLLGGTATLAIVLMLSTSASDEVGRAFAVEVAAKIMVWVVGPSVVLTVTSGLLAMLATPAYHDVGWVWAKAATGILVLQAGLHIAAAVQDGAQRPSPADRFEAEVNMLWVLLAVSAANIALGVWRPQLPKYPV
jgi:hypothetical protein